MRINLKLWVLVLSGLWGSGAWGQVVPAIPGAAPVPANSLDPAQIEAQLTKAHEQLATLRAQVAHVQGSATAELIPTLPSSGAVEPTPTSGTLGADARRLPPVPNAPSDEEVRRLEKQLDRARAQRRALSVVDAGIVTATSASALRAQVVFPYVENSVYEIFAAPDRMTAIELQAGEVISTENGKPKAADTVQWVADTVSAGEGSERRTIVMVKPILSGIETNMLIPTNRHLYSILLRAESRAYMPLVAFSYAAEEARSAAVQGREEAKRDATHEAVNVPPESMNFAYRIKGAKVAFIPLRVFDDGSKTYLQMPAAMKSWEAPALFVIEDKKTPELVNYRVKGDYYIVDRLFHQAQLRVGAKHFVNIFRDDPAGT